MPLKTFYEINVSGLPVYEKFASYPSEEEIEKEIYKRFPDGFIYDQYARQNIYPKVQVNKFYKLDQEEEI
ncbi:hypothetical protein [Planococcus sp. YIM B11945]|uniref:hypothetical protein n=1 Tax=Planococcus sp. YIM B11945 TaxID=3435410 RepID=UPI003D7D558F